MRRRYKKGTTNKKVRNAVSKVYKGIKFRSKLELFTYKELQKAKIKSLYEQKKFVLMKGFYFTNECVEPKKKDYISITTKVRDITYTPDFVDPNGKWIIEVKGFANDVFPLKWKLFKNHLMENGYTYVLFLPKNQKQVLETIQLIKGL
jgi:hypothetical protein